MKLPRDVSGRELAKALAALGYVVDHQTGSHLRLRTTRGGEHNLTIPDHPALKVGTFAALVRALCAHHGLDRDALLELLFG